MWFLFLLAAASLLFAQPSTPPAPPPAAPPDPANFEALQKVAVWSLTVTVRKQSGRSGREGEGLTIYSTNSTFESQSADGTTELLMQGPSAFMKTNVPPEVQAQMKAMGITLPTMPSGVDEEWQWKGIGEGELLINDRYASLESVSGDRTSKTREASGRSPLELTLKINFTKKTYSVTAISPTAPSLVAAARRQFVTGKPIDILQLETDEKGVVTPTKSQRHISLSVTNRPLPTKGTTLEGRIRRTVNRVRETITWKLEPKALIPRLIVDRADDTFLPEPGKAAGFVLRWDHGKPDETTIHLSQVSRETGTCLNSPDQNTKPDVEFDPATPGLAIQGNSAKAVTPINRFNLLTHDYAAYAAVRVTARFGNVLVVGKTSDGDEELVPLVPDEDKNRISDFWQSQVDAEKQAATWDEDALPKTAAKKGDGLTLFEEYRGLFVRGGAHVRLDPRQMELIAVDPDNLLHPATWKAATGAAVIFVDDTQHQGQCVNFNSGYGGVSQKYALKMVKVAGLADPQKTAIATGIWGQTTPDPVAQAPAVSRVFPERPRHGMLSVLLPKVQNAISNPRSPDGVELYGYGYTAALLTRVEAALNNPALMSRYLERIVRHVAIHEAAHACNIGHHQPDTEKGVLSCPMRNFSGPDKFFRIGQELAAPASSSMLPLGITKLCTSGDNCAAAFQLKP